MANGISLQYRILVLAQQVGNFILRWKWVWVGGIGALLAFSHFFVIGVNASESLPSSVYLVLKQERNIQRNDYVAFRWHGGGPYGAGIPFIKLVKGVPGDQVLLQGRDFYVNQQFVATAKTHAKTGKPLDLGPTGIIPPGKYLVFAPHPDSLDSRYAITGWIDEKQIVGRAIPLF